MTGKPLRAHQVSAIAMLRAAIAAGSLAPFLQAPTGAGKGRILAEIVNSARAKGKAVLIVVPAIDLIDQTLEALKAEGVSDVGVIQGQHPRRRWWAPVQVASVQSLARRRMPDADLILIDEAHRRFQFLDLVIADAKERGVPVIGFSATPWSIGLGKLFDRLLQVATTQELIATGFLSPFRVFAPSHPDLTGVRSVGGDFREDDLSKAMNKPDLVADVVSTWLQRGEGRPTLCFAVDRAHAKQLQTQFLEFGIEAGYLDSYSTREERAELKQRFQSGKITVVCNVGCLTTGVDWDVRCIILARPTKSETLFVQIIGRGLRTAEGKTDCLILDHSDSHLRLGFVTDINHNALDNGTKVDRPPPKKPEALPKECAKCAFLRPPRVAECPSCGFKPEPQASVEVEDGHLVEFGKKAARHSLERQLAVYGQLQAHAFLSSYKPGWAVFKFKEYFGFALRRGTSAPLIYPEPDVLRWIKSRQIFHAKSKKPKPPSQRKSA